MFVIHVQFSLFFKQFNSVLNLLWLVLFWGIHEWNRHLVCRQLTDIVKRHSYWTNKIREQPIWQRCKLLRTNIRRKNIPWLHVIRNTKGVGIAHQEKGKCFRNTQLTNISKLWTCWQTQKIVISISNMIYVHHLYFFHSWFLGVFFISLMNFFLFHILFSTCMYYVTNLQFTTLSLSMCVFPSVYFMFDRYNAHLTVKKKSLRCIIQSLTVLFPLDI